MQLDLFDGPLTETQLLAKDLAEVRKQCDNLRRGLFRRLDEVNKMYLEILGELEQLKGIQIEKSA